MEKEQLEKMYWGRCAKSIKAVHPDYDCEGKSTEELKDYMEENNIKMTRSKKENKEEKVEKEDKEEKKETKSNDYQLLYKTNKELYNLVGLYIERERVNNEIKELQTNLEENMKIKNDLDEKLKPLEDVLNLMKEQKEKQEQEIMQKLSEQMNVEP